MYVQNMDDRTKEEIIMQIREKAPSYVPEWRFDEEFPDIGTALALVYADMLSKTLKKLNQVLLKNKIAFFNELDSKLLPAIPAKGYVTFSLVNDEVEGVEIRAGTVVSAQSEDDEIGVINYQTLDDVYVTPSSLSVIYQTSDEDDFIAKLYDKEEPEEELILFELKKANMQKHELYFCHKEALYMKGNGWIYLTFFLRGNVRVSEDMLKYVADKRCGIFEYYAEGSYHEFQSQEIVNGTICLYKEEKQPEFELTQLEDIEGYFIRYRTLEIEPLKQFCFEQMVIRTKGINIVPNSVYANGIESNRKHYFPFGERLTNFSEVYFASSEALCKKNAVIELTFNLEFAKIPLDFNVENDPIKWEWIMKRADFKTDLEYDITIEAVIWEYYNGTGWTRLFSDERYSNVFMPRNGSLGEYKKIEFICPMDIAPLTVNSCESYYIRARVIKVNNLFKMKGSYITPILDNTIFGYDYHENEVRPECLFSYNNLIMKQLHQGESPFIQMGVERKALYLGFDIAPLDGPLKFFIKIKESTDKNQASLLWEYYDGAAWKELNLADETQSFFKSGIVTLMGNRDFGKMLLFGNSRYWIRITDTEGFYSQKDKKSLKPTIQGIYLNTTKVMNVDKEATQYFSMMIYQENTCFALVDKKIISAQIFVNEIDNLDEEQLRELEKEKRLKCVYNDQGIVQEIWVEWIGVNDFVDALPTDRYYVLDKNEGTILFGNGKYGRIPPSSKTDNIRVNYKTGGGSHTNVAAKMIKQLNQGVGFINDVYNPEKLMGGCSVESLDKALERSAATIRHQNRAITVRDYEEIAMAASRSVHRVKCFAGYDSQGLKSPGSITLVVMQKNYKDGALQFHVIKNEIETYLQDKVSGDLLAAGKISVIEPKFVELRIRVEILAKDFNSVFLVKKQVLERLEQFLDPLSGNFHKQGWEIGNLPNHIQIKNALADISEIVFIRNIYITAFSGEAAEWKEVDLESVGGSRYILPIGGKHEVIVGVV